MINIICSNLKIGKFVHKHYVVLLFKLHCAVVSRVISAFDCSHTPTITMEGS